ncbi:MAG: ATP-binding protein [Treponema sp.]|nr:ATP-binding protein [Treponema sp.]
MTTLLLGSLAFFSSMREIRHTNAGRELSQTVGREMLRLEAAVNGEVSLVLKMADSPLVQQYFLNPGDAELEKTAFAEFAGYRRILIPKSIFWANDIDKKFYLNDSYAYTVDPNDPDNYWYNMTLHETGVFNFNINYNPDLNTTNFWINAPVLDLNLRPIGILGTGIDIANFIHTIFRSYPNDAPLFFFNKAGEITGAMDMNLVTDKTSLENELGRIGALIFSMLEDLDGDEIKYFNISGGVAALGAIPEFDWYICAVLPVGWKEILNTSMTVVFAATMSVLAGIIIILNLLLSNFEMGKEIEQAKSASIAKSSFLSLMSHEMRTPLNAVIGLSELTLGTEMPPGEIQANLEKIYNAGSTLLSTVNDILDISKIEAGKLELVEAEYDVPSMINDTITQSIIHIGEKAVEFKLDINEDLPRNLYGDDHRVKQIMNNLLSNACKYTRKGFVELHMHCEREKHDITWIVVSVRDTGIGIKQEDIKKLFFDYSQIDTLSNREIQGTGLGLSITQKIAAMMEGVISVESQYGKGSVFTVRLKQKYVSGATVGSETVNSLKNFRFSAARFDERSSFSHINLPYAQVLVVDDNIANLDVAKGLLKRYGMKIDCVQNGQKAIDAIREEKVKYNAIFMDHMMPGMDGIEAARIIREEIGTEYAKTIPIIALTANALMGNDEIFLNKGFQSFISKPIEIARLDTVIRKWVRDEEQEKLTAEGPHDFHRGQDRRIGLSDRRKNNNRRIGGVEITGLDINGGIKRFGDKKSYFNILHSYVANTRPLLKDLEEVNRDNLAHFAITVHGIKGSSHGIFAVAIGDKAEVLEEAAKNEDIHFVGINTPSFLEDIRKLISDIENMLGNAAEKSRKPKKDKPDRKQLAGLLAACKSYDVDAIDAAMEEIESWEYGADDSLVAWLRENVNQMNYMPIMEKLSVLIDNTEI